MSLNEGSKIQLNTLNNNMELGQLGPNCINSTEPSEEIVSEEIPPIVPCYNGKSLKIHEELVVNGLSAISIRHPKGNCMEDKRNNEEAKQKCQFEEKENREKEDDMKKPPDLCNSDIPRGNVGYIDGPECLKDKMKRRNSFWNIHRPELSKLTWPENFMSFGVLQDFFHNHLRNHGTFCEPLHECTNRSSIMDEEFQDFTKLRELVPPRVLPPDEKVVNIMEKSRSVQLNDEDLDPETMVHKSRAEFCVTIGEYIRKPTLKRTTSQQMPKSTTQTTNNRMESLPLQHEGLLSKETLLSEERVSAIIGNVDLCQSSIFKQKSFKKLNSGNISGVPLRRGSFVDFQRVIAASMSSLGDPTRQVSDQITEDSGDPARLRTILSPREEGTEESGNRT